MKYKIILYSSILLVVIFLQGCVFHPPYPSNWNQLVNVSQCPDLEGTYIDKGERTNDAGEIIGEYPLSSLLIGYDSTSTEEVQFTKIIQEKNKLIIEAHFENSVLEKRVVNYSPDECKDGFLNIEVPNPEGGINREGIVGYSWATNQLSKLTDGSLILRHDSSGYALVYLIPYAGSSWTWYRFQQK